MCVECTSVGKVCMFNVPHTGERENGQDMSAPVLNMFCTDGARRSYDR